MVFLLIKDFTGMAFHALALFFIFLGFKANRELKKMEEQSAVMTRFQQGPALR